MSDQETTVSDLREIVEAFVSERDWHQFHSPKNLSMALAIEAAELMEHFQWLTPEESQQLTAEQRFEVGEEMADVLCYLLGLADELSIDLADALQKKMVKNRLKYPIKEFHGRFGADDPRPSTANGPESNPKQLSKSTDQS